MPSSSAGKWGLSPFLLLASLPAFPGYEANGVVLGAAEKALLDNFPSAYCQPLQWNSRAADRRCDDAKVLIGGVAARITFYLKGGEVQAFDLAFSPRDADRLASYLKARYGVPLAETREQLGPAGNAEREVYKVRWQAGDERAVLTAHKGRRRATLSVSRGDFEEEIYRIR